MTSNANGASSPPISRHNLRQATLILPRTGERVRRAVTFRDTPNLDGANGNSPSCERSPLLSRRSSQRSEAGSRRDMIEAIKLYLKQAWAFVNSRTGRGVLKCSVAYFLGSLATFVPFIAALLGQQDGKHIVATITVYFHPARSKGSMFEAMFCALVAFVYAAFISFTSMGVSILFGQKIHHILIGHIIVLVIFCGGGLGFVGWVKQRLGNPLVNIGCSLTSLAIISVLTKEGAVQAAQFSDDKIGQVMLMILMGVAITTAVSFIISPVSARRDLRDNVIQFTDSLADMLIVITRGFLTGSEEELLQDEFSALSSQHKVLFTSLTTNLREAKFEYYAVGRENEYRLEAKLVDCMHRLSHSIGGLRSAATTQFLLLAQPSGGGPATPTSISFSPLLSKRSFSFRSDMLSSPLESHGALPAIDEAPEDEQNPVDGEDHSREASDDESFLTSAKTSTDIFSRFIEHLGPSMKSLAFTLKQILDELPCGSGPTDRIVVNTHFRSSLVEASKLYGKAREEALASLYRSNEMNKARPIELEADFEEVAASCGHFSFSLQDFADETQIYLNILEDLKTETDYRPRGRTWEWLKIWRKSRRTPKPKGQGDPECDALIEHTSEAELPNDLSSLSSRKAKSPSNARQRQLGLSYKFRIWRGLRILQRDDTKFAIKVGAGAALFALPSFIPSTRPFYQRWRGEWGLLSYMLVCSMTIGASNTTGFARFLGTCIGAGCAIVGWVATQGNPFALAAFGWFMSLWTAYIIVAQGKGPMGRFIMLTYNLSALYAYSLSVKDQNDDDDEGGIDPVITQITLHRVVAVLSGCLWGLIVTRLIWPISARQKFKDGLSLLWLRMGLIWKRDPLASLSEGETPSAYMDLREEFELHRFLTQLENLSNSAASEMDLRGQFPTEEYGRILKSTNAMLDAFHAMNVVISKDLKTSEGEAEILRYTAEERAQLCFRISHLFQVLASSMKLEYPLSEALPNTDHARNRLLAKIFRFRKDSQAAIGAIDADFALLYAFALVTGQLSKEISDVSKRIENLFGVLDEEALKLQ